MAAQDSSVKKSKVVVRIDLDIYTRLSKVADRRKTTTTATIEDGLKFFLDDAETSAEVLMEQVDQQPALKLYRDVIKHIFRYAEENDLDSLRTVIEFIKKGKIEFYEDFFYEQLEEKIKQINNNNCMSVLIIARVNPGKKEPSAPQFNDVLRAIEKISCPHEMELIFDLTLKQEFSFVVFILKKEDSANAKK